MTRSQVVYGVSGAILAAALAVAGRGLASQRDGAPEGVRREAWEYGELTQAKDFSWAGPGGRRHEADTVPKLAAVMGVKGRAEDPIDLLNALGADGWELVARVDQYVPGFDGRGGSSSCSWTFRRRKG